MTERKKHALSWFAVGLIVAGCVFGILTIRNFPGISHSDFDGALLVLGVLATVQFVFILPATCIYLSWRSDAFNFFHAYVLLLGFATGSGLIVAWYGPILFAILYMFFSGGILSALYIVTCNLHKKMHERSTKNRP